MPNAIQSRKRGTEPRSPDLLSEVACGCQCSWERRSCGVQKNQRQESIQFPKNLGSEITVTPAQIPRTILFHPPSLPTLKHVQSISKSCHLTLQNNHSVSISSRHQPSPSHHQLQCGSDNTDPVSPHLSCTYARHCAGCWQYVYVLKRDLLQLWEAGQDFLGQACLKQEQVVNRRNWAISFPWSSLCYYRGRE